MLDFLHELNKEQYAAVSSDINKHMLVIAGAGTGKNQSISFSVCFFDGKSFCNR